MSKFLAFLILFLFTSIAWADDEPKIIPPTEFNVHEATIPGIHDAIQTNLISCQELVDVYLARINQYNLNTDESAPLNAIVEISRNVHEQARQLDEQYTQNKKLSGPLHCIPVVLKDNIDSIDATSTSGSFALLGSQPNKDAFITERLRKAGAIILAKGSMDEFASGLYGLGSRFGRTGNAYDPDKSAGGSSSGPGVAVSANFTVLGIGTDNSGSIRIPAAYNGIYGLRPSRGLISQTGIFPRGNLDGVAGPMARTVEDLAITLDAIAKPDPNDPKTQAIKRPKSYTSHLNPDGLKGKRIGVLTNVAGVDQFRDASEETRTIYNQVFTNMTIHGAKIIHDIELPEFDVDRTNNMAGDIDNINAYLKSFPSTRKDLIDICTSERTNNIGGSEKDCIKYINKTPNKNSQEYMGVLETFTQNRINVEDVMSLHNLDTLIVPVDAYGAATNAYDPSGINCLVASNAGLPGLSMIAGYTEDNMPVGLELIGKQYDEAELIEIAYAYEQKVGPRVPPILAATKTDETLNIEQFNNFINVLGKASWEQVIKEQKVEGLTPSAFRKIVEEQGRI